MVEALPRILPAEDAEISELARKAFARQGIAIHTGTRVERLAKGGGQRHRHAAQAGRQQRGDRRGAASSSPSASPAMSKGSVSRRRGSKIDKGHIVVDEWCRTGAPGLYAIGDVVGPPWLAHKASHEGIICVEKIAGVEGVHPLDKTAIPACTYSAPQIASVGLTEEACPRSAATS